MDFENLGAAENTAETNDATLAPEGSEQTPEVAEPESTGGQEQPVAEAAGDQSEGTEMSPEERRTQAARRRDAERAKLRQEIAAQERARLQKEVDASFAAMGKTDPYTGKVITTQAEWDAYVKETNRRNRERELKKAGLSMETIEGLIDEHPAIRQAKEREQQLDAELRKAERMQARLHMEEELKEIAKIDPNIATVDALMEHPKYEEIKRLVQQNNHTVAEAFKIATQEDRAAQSEQRVRQAAAAKSSSKAHLISAAGAGGAGDSVTVPQGMMELYRAANPKITQEEARKKYARYLSYKQKG